ncbi:MAG: AAA family ATPase [Candidatus Levybacteria bacterium]|nr:AAA family ATPase [Candidatus Levybacteria bacterium]
MTDNAVLNDKTRVNFQIIFNCEGSEDEINERLNQFYNQLKLSSTDKIISNQSFIELAKDYSDDVLITLVGKKRAECKNEDFLNAGNKSCYISYECIKKILKNEDLRKDLLIIIPWDKYGGIEKIDAIFRDDIKKKVTLLADIIESTNGETIDLFHLEESFLSTKSWSNSWKQFLNKKQKPCICGSDAHSIENYSNFPDNKPCWIKADLTFEGLRQIIFEPELRAYVGSRPAILSKIDESPTRFIDNLSISHTDEYKNDHGVWFKNIEMPINYEFTAIIGNKGSGKSAIADILGLIGESKKVIDAASFLNSDKFKKKGLANNFKATVTWKSGDPDSKNLNAEVDPSSHEKVQYLPQHWFETLCNDLDGKQFNEVLEKVVFTHLEESERLGQTSFSDLLQYKSQSTEEDIKNFRAELHSTNIELAKFLKKMHPSYEKELKSNLDQKKRELGAHEKNKPKNVRNPDINKNQKNATKTILDKIEKLNKEIFIFEENINKSIQLQVNINKKLEDLKRLEEEVVRLRLRVKKLPESFNYKELFGKLFKADDLVSFTVNSQLISDARLSLVAQLKTEKNKNLNKRTIETDSNLKENEKKTLLESSNAVKLELAKNEREELKKKLNKPQEEYQAYIEGMKDWNNKELLISGVKNNPSEGTINYYQKEIEDIKKVVEIKIKTLQEKQYELSQKIYNKKNEVVDIYKAIKTKVDSIIMQNQGEIEDYKIGVEAGYRLLPDFEDTLLNNINLRAKGSFMEKNNAHQQLKKILEDRELKEFNEIKNIVSAINDYINDDKRQDLKETERKRYVDDQISDPISFYDYLFGLDYLKENYQLNLDNKNLESLSPGEKGALLLVFYLMLDQEDIPLIIDQPEDNLDNQSVSRILVKFIKNAKSRRQIIMVTHNPNLAIVADAEQIIYVQIDKANKNIFSFEAGSIENERINKRIVDVLEGTMPAFDKRRLRYLKKDV